MSLPMLSYPKRLPLPALTAVTLNDLLVQLYPDPVPDIFTLNDFLRRYRLTRLGEPALKAITQSERINRAHGDHTQMGLCAFHIGLIFLHSGDFRSAAGQFEEAQRQWRFADRASAIALALFAEGQALEYAHSFEKAMGCYQKMVQWLRRAEMKGTEELRPFLVLLRQQLADAQESLRGQMWAGEPEPVPPTAKIAYESPTVQEYVPASSPPPLPETAVPPPTSNLSQYDHQVIPGHHRTDVTFDWYQTGSPPTGLFNHLEAGSWLLIQRDPTLSDLKIGRQVIILSPQPEAQAVRLQPFASKPASSYIYLGQIEHVSSEALFSGQKLCNIRLTPEILLTNVVSSSILGMVVGVWKKLA